MSEPQVLLSGLLAINKHEGITSHGIVGRVRRLYNTRQVGHTGTLDPLATGVLPVMVGRAVKAAEYLSAEDKKYCAKIKLGVTSDTEDITGTLVYTGAPIPSTEEFFAVLPKLTGEIEQIPPMYSALKVNGQKLVDIARSGETVERKVRRVKIYSLEAETTGEPDEYILHVHCSKGTYIRTLCSEIGARLDCGAVMKELVRTETCGISLDDSYTVEELEQMTMEERIAILFPTERLFEDLPWVTLGAFYSKLSRCGTEIYQKKIQTDYETGARVRICDENGFFALGEVQDFEQGSAIKMLKLFVL